MTKVVFACDGGHFSEGSFSFAKYLAEHQQLLLTGAFLPTVEYSELLYSFGGLTGPLYVTETLRNSKAAAKNAAYFQAKCEEAGIPFVVHNSATDHVLNELRKESRFADLLLIGSERFYDDLGSATADDYLTDTLHNAECPVVVVPEEFNKPERVVIGYDGSAASVYAIKQLSYTIPHTRELPVMIVYASTHNGIPEQQLVEELVSNHFSHVSFYKLDIDPDKYFDTWLTENKNILFAAGGYARSFLSLLFKRSFVSDMLKAHKFPVFIAHR